MKRILYLALSILLIFCTPSKKNKQETGHSTQEQVLIVAPYKVNCVGVAPMQCLLIKKSEKDRYSNFYSSIKGFTHKAGTSYTIKVKVSKKDDVPADAASLVYELIEIIESKPYAPDPIVLYDIWGVVDVLGDNPLKLNCEQTLEINTTDSVIMGKGGCNNFRGEIKCTTSSNQISFEKILTSRRTCVNQNLENKYLETLNKVDAYFRFEQHLYLIHNDEVLIKCKRMD